MTGFYPDSVLAERHIFTILLCAQDRGSIRSTDIHEYIKNWGTIGERLDFMVGKGLLEESVAKGGRLSMVYQLTDKGRFIAQMLRCCDAALDGDFDIRNDSVDRFLSKD